MGRAKLHEVNFLSLQTAVFCVACELISQNNTPGCLACGSQALLGLSRVLGGSLRNHQNAHLIVDSELDRLVRELIRTVPQPELLSNESALPASFPPRLAGRHHTRARFSDPERDAFSDREIHSAEMNFHPAINVIAERAQTLTRATGAAIALRKGNEIVCRARTGRTAPDLGVRLQTDSGISAECVRTGEVVLCHDAQGEDLQAENLQTENAETQVVRLRCARGWQAAPLCPHDCGVSGGWRARQCVDLGRIHRAHSRLFTRA